MDWLWIALGLTILIASAELLVRGAVWCALALGVSPMMVGLTLVAFGTSAPELFVSLAAAFEGKPGFATGSVLGSNIANIGLIVGLAALLQPITHLPRSARFEVRFVILTGLLVFVPLVQHGPVRPVHGVVLLGLLGLFMMLLIRRERVARAIRHERREPTAEASPPCTPRFVLLHVAMVLAGLAGLKFGGDWLVLGASGVALAFGMSDAIVGTTVIAVGTSLPELATSAVAARRGHPEIALGNVLGSNIFNVCMVLGITSLVAPLPMSWAEEGTAACVGLAMAILLGLLLRFAHGVSRRFGALLLLTYLGYVTFAIWSQRAGG